MASKRDTDRLTAIIASYRTRRNGVDPSKLAVAIDGLSRPPSKMMMVLFNTLAYSTVDRGMEAPVESVPRLTQKLKYRMGFISPRRIASALEHYPHYMSKRMLDLFEKFSRDSLPDRILNSFRPGKGPAVATEDGLSLVNNAHYRSVFAGQDHGRSKVPFTISILISRSAALENWWETMCKSAEEYIRDMNSTARKARVSIVLFDKEKSELYRWEPIANAGGVPRSTRFRSGAKLFDAIAHEIREVRNFRALNEHYGYSLIAVYTDGLDSGSVNSEKSIQKWIREFGDTLSLAFPNELEASERLAKRLGTYTSSRKSHARAAWTT